MFRRNLKLGRRSRNLHVLYKVTLNLKVLVQNYPHYTGLQTKISHNNKVATIIIILIIYNKSVLLPTYFKDLNRFKLHILVKLLFKTDV